MIKVLDRNKHSKKMREMGEKSYSQEIDDKDKVCLLGDIIENATISILDLIECETDEIFDKDYQVKIIQTILMDLYRTFRELNIENQEISKIKFDFEKYTIKLYLIYRLVPFSEMLNDKEIQEKVNRQYCYLKNLFL